MSKRYAKHYAGLIATSAEPLCKWRKRAGSRNKCSGAGGITLCAIGLDEDEEDHQPIPFDCDYSVYSQVG